MNEPDIEAHVESRTNEELTELVRRLHHVYGFDTRVSTHGGAEFVFYSAPDTGPSGVLWVLGDEPPRESHVERLRNVREHASVERAGLVAKREPWTPLDEESVEVLTPETLASTIAGLDDPTEVVPEEVGLTTESEQTEDESETAEAPAQQSPSDRADANGSWAAATTNRTPTAVEGDYWDGQSVGVESGGEPAEYWDETTTSRPSHSTGGRAE
jgi:hypothetical protein